MTDFSGNLTYNLYKCIFLIVWQGWIFSSQNAAYATLAVITSSSKISPIALRKFISTSLFTYLNRGTTFHITEKSASGEMALEEVLSSTNTFRSSSVISSPFRSRVLRVTWRGQVRSGQVTGAMCLLAGSGRVWSSLEGRGHEALVSTDHMRLHRVSDWKADATYCHSYVTDYVTSDRHIIVT